MKRVVLLILAIVSFQLNAQEIIGDWHGVLSVQGTSLRIVFHVTSQDGAYQSTLDSPDQGAYGIQMDKTTFVNGELEITASALNAQYFAVLGEEGDTLIGTFEQNGMTFELNMSRQEGEPEAIVRPQDPKDFPYYVEEVKFENPKGGHSLAGTLTMPENGKFKKAVILISGSGPQDRNEEVMNHRPFLVLSDHLTRNGLAVLRYDDRGVGESEGEFQGSTSMDFADDAAAAVSYLKSRKDMKGKKIGLAGHSEGGMIAPMVAVENEDVDFMVLLSAPGIKITELLLIQQDRIGEVQGVPVSFRETNAGIAKEMFEYLENNTDLAKEQLEAGLREFLDRKYDELTAEMQGMIGPKENFINQQSRIVSSDWYLSFIGVNPDTYLSKVKCPVLAVNGELDLQVSSKENLEGIRTSLQKAKNKKHTIHEFKDLNHLFQVSETGAPSEYAQLEETFNVDAMDYISNWILAL